jgi:hypothetical protein
LPVVSFLVVNIERKKERKKKKEKRKKERKKTTMNC